MAGVLSTDSGTTTLMKQTVTRYLFDQIKGVGHLVAGI